MGRYKPLVHQRPAQRADVGQEHPTLAVGHLAQPAAVLPGHSRRFPALLGEVAAIEHPHRLRVSQPGGQVFLQPPYDCLIGPPGLGEKALHPPGRDAHRFREILGVAPLLVLHQQRLKVIPAVIPPLLAAEGGRKEGVEFLKAVVDPLEARRIHHPNHPTSSVQPSYQTTRRCSTRGAARNDVVLYAVGY